MLPQACPDCKTPIFKLKSGEIICPCCNRPVVFAKFTEAEKVATGSATISQLEEVIMNRISSLRETMASTEDPHDLEKVTRTLVLLFDLLERVRKTKG